MKIVVAASPKVAIPSIESLLDTEHTIQIVSQPDTNAGRGLIPSKTEVANNFANVLKPVNEAELQKILEGSDLLVTIGYGRILSLKTLLTPKHGGINLHFSLLPRWRGAAPVQRSIEAGDQVTGVTVFQMDEGVDTGQIWVQEEFKVPPNFSSIELFEALALLGANALIRAIKMIEGGGKSTPQIGNPSLARKILKSDAIINWQEPAIVIDRKIKAFAENPVARSVIRGDVLKILESEVSKANSSSLAPGQLSETGAVGTGDGELQLLKVIPAGKRAMSCKDWLNGFRPGKGEFFG
jgi:methionyl-tRNA formyltransferase